MIVLFGCIIFAISSLGRKMELVSIICHLHRRAFFLLEAPDRRLDALETGLVCFGCAWLHHVWQAGAQLRLEVAHLAIAGLVKAKLDVGRWCVIDQAQRSVEAANALFNVLDLPF